MKAIPTDDKSTVSKVFGRATWFALVKDGGVEFLSGTSANEHGAGTGAVSLLADRGVDEVVAAEVGPKARDSLVAAGIAITLVRAGTPISDIA
ncbi:MAG TPA: NifB/NifX family molybdenum-iron cluster-binding protein [Spirochaetales bacterium]|nr:hypothetical protein [Spirochaetales bacterium]MBP7264252.1 dinitrogenase iron-molybdenum cofactor biosynthesis protein [Spirochaetia bacterium]HPE36057.1 NifB/NifX family molybdenum-iron cluster-binding protein [Spirochaetales bacterium]